MLKALLFFLLLTGYLLASIPGIAPRSIITPWNSEAQQAYAGAMKDYDGTYSFDPDGGTITAYHWYVDDVEVGTGSTLSHVFTLEKTETSRIVYLKLKVQDDEGATGKYGFEVAVLRKPQNNYYLKDHLGNIRMTVDENGDVVGSQDYYPFGLQMAGRSGNNTYTSDVYKYSGKELDEESGLNWYWFNPGRYLDPAVGRWMSVDPLAHKRPSLTPYNYARNNPLVFIDPTGLIDIYLWFNNSSLTPEQQKIVSNNIATSFTNAGVEDVNVKTASWFHRKIIGGGVGDNVDIKFENISDPEGGNAGGTSDGYGNGKGTVFEKELPVDDKNTDIDEKATAASNVGTHEIGHSSKAKLKHTNPADGSVMDANINATDVGAKRKDFNKQHSDELQKVYNEENR